MTNQLNLPEPVQAYFDAERRDDQIAHCFTRDAVVVDEGHTYTGPAAIQAWKTAASQKYTSTSKPIACTQEGGETVVISHTSGNFPGSPVDLRYAFRLERGKIAAMKVTL